MLANHMSSEGPVSTIQGTLDNEQSKIKNPIKIGTKDMKKYFTKEDSCLANKPRNRHFTPLVLK